MTMGLAVCLVCEESLDYFEKAQKVNCSLCGEEATAHSLCSAGHYVCDTCHRSKGVEQIITCCRTSDSKNPVELAMRIMKHKAIYSNGPEHHTLVGAVLLTAYHNAGGDINFAEALDELCTRSLEVPGGTCGFWGTCGAAVSAGMYMSILLGATPLTREPWAQTMQLTARILDHLAKQGGPRCCKRSSFTSIRAAAEYTEELFDVRMEMPKQIVCTHYPQNKECLKKECPYFPAGQAKTKL